MAIEKRNFTPTYTRETGLFVVNLDTVNDLPFEVKERSFVNIPPKEMGGNHKHPRWEAIVGIGSGLKLIWQGENDSKHEEVMNPDGHLFIFIVSPNTPHTVVNTSETEIGVLLEFASGPQHSVETVELLKS